MLHVWGCGQFGQHGHGHMKNVPPKNGTLELNGNEKFKLVACGASHTIALSDNDQLYGWGNNWTQQLGLAAKHVYIKPVPISASYLEHQEIAGVSCGSRQSFVWTKSGECFCYGKFGLDHRNENAGDSGPLAPLLGNMTVREIACGATHAVFCLQDGGVLSVGSNNRGQLGNGEKSESKIPVRVNEIESAAIHVACGNLHSICLTDDNSVYNWGYGPACGQDADITTAHVVEFGDHHEELVKLQGGDSHSIALASDGKIYMWGSNSEGQFGTSITDELAAKPVCMTELMEKGRCIDISARDDTTAVVLESGEVFMWGKNLWSVLDGGSSMSSTTAGLHEVDLQGAKAVRVSLGSWHVGVITKEDDEEKAFEVDDNGGITENCCAVPTKIVIQSQKLKTVEYDLELTQDIKTEPMNDVDTESNRGCINMEDGIIKRVVFESKANNKDSKDKPNQNEARNIREQPIEGLIGQSKKIENRRTFQRSNTFSTGFLLPSATDYKISENALNNNVCSFVSFSDEEAILRKNTPAPQSKKTSNRNGNRISSGMLNKKLSSEGPFITQLQPDRKDKIRKGHFQQVNTSVWNTEMLLEMSSKFASLGQTNPQRPQTAATNFNAHLTNSFQRSKSVEVNNKGRSQRTWQLPKLQGGIELTQNRYSKSFDTREVNNNSNPYFSTARMASESPRNYHYAGK